MTLLVVVDTIDETADWELGVRHLPRLPGKRVRIVLSTRHTLSRPSPAAWIARLRPLSFGGPTELGALGTNAFEELLRQVRPARDAASAEVAAAAASRLRQLTAGDPVTTALYLQDLAEQPGNEFDWWAAGLDRARPGLAGFFKDWWRDQERRWRSQHLGRLDEAQRVLNLLAVAEGPLQLGELKGLAGRLGESMSGARMDQALALADRFVRTGAWAAP
jgi:hypothetical protein